MTDHNEDKRGMVDPQAVPCAECGCMGNCSCGHEPLDKEKCCTLDAYSEVCPCCYWKRQHPEGA